jgi:hypothetical protein
VAVGESKRVRTFVISLGFKKSKKGGNTHERTFIRQLYPTGTIRYYKSKFAK